jgi:hypothetical protein
MHIDAWPPARCIATHQQFLHFACLIKPYCRFQTVAEHWPGGPIAQQASAKNNGHFLDLHFIKRNGFRCGIKKKNKSRQKKRKCGEEAKEKRETYSGF